MKDRRLKMKYFATPKRKNSQLEILNPKTNEKKVFTKKRKISEGTYGVVSTLECGDEKFVVKATKDMEEFSNLDEDQLAAIIKEAEDEARYMHQCYPDEEPYKAFHFPVPESDGDGYKYVGRLLMPLINGKKLFSYARDNIRTYDEMARLFLAVAKETHRLHTEAGVIHGDAGERNILILNGKPHFIDFGCSYPVDGLASTGFKPKNPFTSDMAPEREGKRHKLKAHPEQDVFSLAIAFSEILKKRGKKWTREFFERYPVIYNFINNGKMTDWKYRPGLENFTRDLESNLEWQAHLPQSLGALVQALEKSDGPKIQQLLNHHKYSKEELAQLLHHLLWNHEYDRAELLMNMTNIPIDRIFDGDNCLHVAAASHTISLDLFVKLLHCMPKAEIQAAINQPNQFHETVMHTVAHSNRPELVRELLKFSPDLSKTDLGKYHKRSECHLACEVAEPATAPMLKLFTYIQLNSHPNQKKITNRLFNTNNSDALTAARCMADHVLSHTPLESDFAKYCAAIRKTPKLAEIYKNLVAHDFLDGPSLSASDAGEPSSRKRRRRS